MSTSPATVIAFVPGTTASELILGVEGIQQKVWPDILRPSLNDIVKAAYGEALEHLANATLGDIVMNYPVAPTGAAGETPCYQDFVDFVTCQTPFNGALGTPFTYYSYSGSTDDLPSAPDRLFYAVPYDWRLNNATSATNRLQPALDLLSSIYPDGNYTLHLVAHSNGGLVSRYLLEQVQAAQNSAWWPKLQSLITLATPHLGSPLAWKAIVGEPLSDGEKALAIGFISTVVNNANFPSTFELLPPENQPFISDFTDNIGFVDIYSAGSFPSSQLYADMKACSVNFDNLTAAATFAAELATPTPPNGCTYHFFYGTGLQTLDNNGSGITAFTYNPNGGSDQGSADAAKIFIPEAGPASGDGIVPAWSASFAMAATSDTIRTQSFSQYSHGYMGGCDMRNHPDSIVAMLELCGVTDINTISKAAE